MDIKDYLDSEGILDVTLNDLNKLISAEERRKIEEIANRAMGYKYNFEAHQQYYTMICQMRINGVPLIVPTTGTARSEIEQSAPIILEHIKNDILILDVASGIGHKTRFYGLNVEGRVIGLDINQAVLDIANRRKNGNMAYIRGDVFKLPFRDELFDSVLYCNAIQEDGVFYGIYGDGNYDDMKLEKIKELSRVLKINGKMIIGHNGFDDYPEEVIEAMARNGIEIAESYTIDYSKNNKERINHVAVGVKKW